MIRKLLVVAAAIAMPVSVIAVSGGMASASNSHASAATGTATCTGLKGSIAFTPHLSSKGDGTTPIKAAVTAKLSGCKGVGATISAGSVSGTLTGAPGTKSKPSGTCIGLASGNAKEVGTLTIKWTPSSVPATVLKVASDNGGTASGHGTFTIPGNVKSTVSGSFAGTDKGAKDKSLAETTATAASILSSCTKGIASLPIQGVPGKTAVTLG
jgi:hypothetical protein